MSGRFVVAGLARARTSWFDMVGRWANEAAIPVDFVRCVSAAELRSRLDGGRAWSAVLLAADANGVDRDLLAACRDAGAVPLVVVDDLDRDWQDLGAAALLHTGFERQDLVDLLRTAATPVSDDGGRPVGPGTPVAATRHGRLVAVTGPGGTGASTAAIALAQGLAEQDDEPVVLADLRRVAEQAMLHDARTVVPGLQELVEAHRTGAPGPAQVRATTFAVPARGYELLLGLRRPRQWPALRPAALGATLDGLRAAYGTVVVDVDPEVEGEQETGSPDVEERHLASRLALGRADAVVVVGLPGMKGLYAQARLLGELLAFGVPADRIVSVVNRAPRRRAARAELTRALAELLDAQRTDAPLASPVFVPERRVDEALRDGVALPTSLVGVLVGGVARLTTRPSQSVQPPAPVPVAVRPGELGLEGGLGA